MHMLEVAKTNTAATEPIADLESARKTLHTY